MADDKSTPESSESGAQVHLDWTRANEMSVSPVNMFLVQGGPEGFVLNIGHALPPIPNPTASPEQPVRTPVNVVARILISPGVAGALVEALGDIASQSGGEDEDESE